MHFAPMSLRKFAQTFNVNTPKGVWPYEYFTCLEEIENCIEYPPIGAFKSSLMQKIDGDDSLAEWNELKNNFDSMTEMCEFFGVEMFTNDIFVSPKAYFIAKKEYETRVSNGEWFSMLCVLKDYNKNDCEILYAAMKNFIEMVRQEFGAHVLSKMTLPGLAEGFHRYFYTNY